ncbi:uncharacterized protein CC84DRAFT_1209906 [Paraphaeosphaeria sporulosa]|uniref:Uncharacterized protein n=1 Tax=Paraphaeosphaeria sporulosa TaxID=1460663 RepID=A0A177BX93_9PLEO|nr:uncharacterized protein CC84DRAFT_1209906 [Paraphaeosphaeria sporulosa]OAF99570.1 hypothetical protein CC84DRAFT_1209906 [Paraphaeosphaeria sporulosa]
MVRPQRVRAFDEATGQVYEETQVPVTSMVSAWPDKCNGRKTKPQSYRHRGLGASSLYDMAMRSCAWHINLFMPSDLQSAEWHFAHRIYEHLQKNQNLTANAWSLFQQAFPGEAELNRTYPIRIPALYGQSASELPSIQQWLRLLPFSHLLLLNIQCLCLRLDDLITLTTLPNLGVLLMRFAYDKLPQELDDKAMRDWSRAVKEKGAFTQLRVVGLHHHAASLPATLKGLSQFPALRICTVEPQPPLASSQAAISQIASAALPFELLVDDYTGTADSDTPEAVWSKGNLPGHVKMKMLYDLAGRMHPDQAPEDVPDSAVLSVYYGAERNLAYNRYPLWFKRLGSVETEYEAGRQPKRYQDDQGGEERTGGGKKPRRLREGKQMDIGSLLGGFG